LAEMYFMSGSTSKLSSILQCSVSNSELQAVAADDDTVNCLCKLVMQYIQLKLDTDLEEMYLCFRLLRRFSKKSEVFRQLYDVGYPYLQTCIRGSYGGSLNLSPLEE
ncbi:DNA repair protein REV1-like protein, partial [Drosera capensis]